MTVDDLYKSCWKHMVKMYDCLSDIKRPPLNIVDCVDAPFASIDIDLTGLGYTCRVNVYPKNLGEFIESMIDCQPNLVLSVYHMNVLFHELHHFKKFIEVVQSDSLTYADMDDENDENEIETSANKEVCRYLKMCDSALLDVDVIDLKPGPKWFDAMSKSYDNADYEKYWQTVRLISCVRLHDYSEHDNELKTTYETTVERLKELFK